MEGLVQNFGPTASVLLLVIYMLIKDRRNGKNSTINPSMGITRDQMGDMYKSVTELHWQTPQMLTELKGIRTGIGELTAEIRTGHKRLRESLDEQTGEVVKNTATIELLEGKIAELN